MFILNGGLKRGDASGKGKRAEADIPATEMFTPAELSHAIEAGSVLVVDVDHSMDYREAHLPGAVWSTRSRIDRMHVPLGVQVVLYSEHETRARLAAIDLAEVVDTSVAVLAGGREAWVAAGLTVEEDSNKPPDDECIDFLFWVSQRHMGSDEAAVAYLEWEENLPAQIEADGDARFTVMRR